MQPQDIGYINLHGTATPLNDQIESQVVHDLFGESVPCSSTKHLTGHTLGAAGITEAALSWLILTRDLPCRRRISPATRRTTRWRRAVCCTSAPP
jgi:3-oxoacyl-[acyl-carrier-protein] synthase-1